MKRALGAMVILLLSSACADVLGVEQKEQVFEKTPPGARPPPRPEGAEVGTVGARAFAVRRYYLGAIDPDTDEFDAHAWRKIGFDLDGVNTHGLMALGDTPGTCVPSVKVELDSLADGLDGRDNNFGSQVLPLLAEYSEGLDATEKNLNTSVSKGGPTLVVHLQDLNEGADDPHVEISIMLSAQDKDFKPAWNTVDRFPIDTRTLVTGTMYARTKFVNAYMSGNTVVSGDFNTPPDTTLYFPVDPAGDASVFAPLAFTLTLTLDETHDKILSSTLSIALTIGEFLNLVDPIKDRFLGCYASALPLIQPCADLRSDRPSFLDPTSQTECDAISLALRLDWEEVRIPTDDDRRDVTPSGLCP